MTKTQENIAHKRAKGQPFLNRWPQGKSAYNRHENTNCKKDPQMWYHIGTVSKKLLEDLNMFDGANLILNSDADQDKQMSFWTT